MIEQFMEKVAMEKVALRRVGKEALKVIGDYNKLRETGYKYHDLPGVKIRFDDAAGVAGDKAARLTGFNNVDNMYDRTWKDVEDLENVLKGRSSKKSTFHKPNYGEPLKISPERAARRTRIKELAARQKVRHEDPEAFGLLKKYSE